MNFTWVVDSMGKRYIGRLSAMDAFSRPLPRFIVLEINSEYITIVDIKEWGETDSLKEICK